jgi:hypothetical protein
VAYLEGGEADLQRSGVSREMRQRLLHWESEFQEAIFAVLPWQGLVDDDSNQCFSKSMGEAGSRCVIGRMEEGSMQTSKK